jgi:hypothetical protein
MVDCVPKSMGQLVLSAAVLVIAFFNFGFPLSFLVLLEASIVCEALSTIS